MKFTVLVITHCSLVEPAASDTRSPKPFDASRDLLSAVCCVTRGIRKIQHEVIDKEIVWDRVGRKRLVSGAYNSRLLSG